MEHLGYVSFRYTVSCGLSESRWTEAEALALVEALKSTTSSDSTWFSIIGMMGNRSLMTLQGGAPQVISWFITPIK